MSPNFSMVMTSSVELVTTSDSPATLIPFKGSYRRSRFESLLVSKSLIVSLYTSKYEIFTSNSPSLFYCTYLNSPRIVRNIIPGLLLEPIMV